MIMRTVTVILIIMVLITMGACTYTISLINTEGVASDVLDETDSVSPDVPITLPITMTPSGDIWPIENPLPIESILTRQRRR